MIWRSGILQRGWLVAMVLAMTACGVAWGDFPLNPFRKSPPAQDPFAARGGMAANQTAQPVSTEAPAVRLAQYQRRRNRLARPRRPTAARSSNIARPLPQLRPVAQPIARIGDETIFDIEVAGAVNQQLTQRAGPDMSPRQIEQLRRELTQQALASIIDQRMVVYKARKEIPADAWPKIEKSVNEQFDKTHLKELMTRANATTRHELDRILQQSGTSVERQKKVLPRTQPGGPVDSQGSQLRARGHAPGNARLLPGPPRRIPRQGPGQLGGAGRRGSTASHPRTPPTRRSPKWATKSFRAGRWPKSPARNPTASPRPRAAPAAGPTKPALRRNRSTRRLFTLPPGRLSRIIEDPRGFYIVRVIDARGSRVQKFRRCADRDSRKNQKGKSRSRRQGLSRQSPRPNAGLDHLRHAGGRGKRLTPGNHTVMRRPPLQPPKSFPSRRRSPHRNLHIETLELRMQLSG